MPWQAFESNIRLAHVLAIIYLLRNRNPAMIITSENPMVRAATHTSRALPLLIVATYRAPLHCAQASMKGHPLVENLLERECADGGLGSRANLISYCRRARLTRPGDSSRQRGSISAADVCSAERS